MSSVRIAPLLKKLASSAVALVVAVLLMEAATRMFSSVQPPLFVNDPRVGKTYLPGTTTTIHSSESGHDVVLRINRDGMRDRDHVYGRSSGTRRIAILGDSMIAAMQTDEEHTTVRVLERLLGQSAPGDGWDVMSFAVSGSSTGQELALYREVASRYDVDTVICAFFVGNDFGDNSPGLTSSRHRIYFDVDEQGNLFQLPVSVTQSRASRWLNAHSRLYVLQKNVKHSVQGRVEEGLGILPAGKLVFRRNPPPEGRHAWDILEQLVRTMKAEVEAHGSRFALAVLPAAEQIYDEPWDEILELSADGRDDMDRDNPERRVAEICERQDIALVTMVDRFRAAAPRHSIAHEDEWLYYDGTGHFNVAGNRLAAEILRDFLPERGAARVDSPDRSSR